MKPEFKAALENCEREPVHVPGQIQPFAALLAFNVDDFLTTHYTPNVLTFTSKSDPDSHLGEHISNLISNRELIHAIRGALGLPSIRKQRERLGVFTLNGKPSDVGIYVVDNIAVIEIEECGGLIERSGTAISRVRTLLASLETNQGIEPLLESAVKVLRHLTGYDRVMAYRFLSDASGEITAEECAPGLTPFLGLRYPAYDIPPQVRKIALSSTIRIIHNIDAEPVPLIDKSELPLDLTLCHSRAVAPIHVEYLQNMSVRSTMNISIIVRGELWGLFAFHHEFPRLLSPDYRTIAELFGHLFSLQLQQEIDNQILMRRHSADAVAKQLRSHSNEHALEPLLELLSTDLMKVVGAHGMSLTHHDESYTFGNCPDLNGIRAIGQWADDELVAIESIQSVTELASIEGIEWNNCGGFLSILIDDEHSRLLFFRNEITHEIRWGGMPEKKIDYGPHGPRLHPRSSFTEYTEKVAGLCEPWSPEDLSTVTEIRLSLLEMLYRDVRYSSDEYLRQKQFQDLLIAELNHRVKNILSLVRSIALQTRHNTTDLDEYVAAFIKRITAMVAAHDLVGGSGVQWVSLKQLFQIELAAYLNADYKVKIDGPATALRSNIAPVMALVIHELTANAVKYGALSGPEHALSISWKPAGGGLEIQWREQLKDGLTQPGPRGFGMSLIDRALSHECGGKTRINFGERGLDVEFWVPQDGFNQIAVADLPVVTRTEPANRSDFELDADNILILEDNLVLAMELENTVTGMGCRNVLTSSSIEEAEGRLKSAFINCAIIDININGTPSFELGQKLKKSEIPFLFVSGYGNTFPIPEELETVPRLLKPVDIELLHETLSRLLDSRS